MHLSPDSHEQKNCTINFVLTHSDLYTFLYDLSASYIFSQERRASLGVCKRNEAGEITICHRPPTKDDYNRLLLRLSAFRTAHGYTALDIHELANLVNTNEFKQILDHYNNVTRNCAERLAPVRELILACTEPEVFWEVRHAGRMRRDGAHQIIGPGREALPLETRAMFGWCFAKEFYPELVLNSNDVFRKSTDIK